MMTRKDYQRFAAMLAGLYVVAGDDLDQKGLVDQAKTDLGDLCQRDNTRFNRARFEAAVEGLAEEGVRQGRKRDMERAG